MQIHDNDKFMPPPPPGAEQKPSPNYLPPKSK